MSNDEYAEFKTTLDAVHDRCKTARTVTEAQMARITVNMQLQDSGGCEIVHHVFREVRFRFKWAVYARAATYR